MKTKFLAAALLTAVAGVAQAEEAPSFKLKPGSGITFENADGTASFRVGGRLQWDYDSTDSDISGKSDDFDVRRARIFFEGKYLDWAFKAQFNLAESGSGGSAEDLYLRYTGFGEMARITVGKQKEPFGLEELTSSKDISSLERTALTEFYAPGRSAGVQLHGGGDNWTYGLGLFEADWDSSDDFGSTAITGRVTYAPIQTDDLVLHLGAGFTSRDADLAADQTDAYNIELAAASGPFHTQAEYFNADTGGVDVDGYYIQAGWILTGESRPYSNGVFKRVKPSSSKGAWEAVLRYEDGYGKFSDVGLGTTEGQQTTVGINYYPNNAVRLGLSYMEGKQASGEKGKEIRARMQFVF